MRHFSYILLGIAPSIIWLLYYLKKDLHPEPRRKILAVFFGGALAAVLAGIAETLIIKNIRFSYQNLFEASLIFTAVAVIEEVSKYIPFRLQVLKDKELDEPIDIPVYLITSALGFAALENVFLFFSKGLKFLETFLVSWFRFVGATLLHAVCSGILGFFIALSFAHKKKGKSLKAKLYSISGFLIAILLHTLYNFSIIKAREILRIALPLAFLGVTGFVLSCSLGRLGKLRGVCKD